MNNVRFAFALAALAGLSPVVSAMELQTGDLGELRQEAIALVNAVREDEGLAPLSPNAALDNAAQDHAAGMLQEGYYAHVAPDGTTPTDRFIERGGSQWRVVRENIARCSNCAVPPSIERVQSFQQGWMNSPEHRDNILAGGLDSFGFGIAGDAGRVFAVQMFSGAGTPRGAEGDEEPVPVGQGEMAQQLVAAVNRERKQEGLQPVTATPALSDVARQLLPEQNSSGLADPGGSLFDLLPQGERGNWRQLQVLSAACGGCGAQATVQDIEGFVDQWMNNPQHSTTLMDEAVRNIGFAMRVDGEGRKTGIAVVGQ